jgi:hypothetical protein
VSTGTISPDERMFYARLRAPQPLLESDAGLDVLGIRYVVATSNDAVAPGLQPRGTVPDRRDGTLVVYENSNPWPDVFVVDAMSEQTELPAYPGCSHTRLTCRDFAAMAGLRRATDGLLVRRREGRFDIRMIPAGEPRLLVVSQMFRPDWMATGDGQPLTATSVFGGLIGVRVPPNVTSIALRYRPWTVMIATVTAWFAIAASVTASAVMAWSTRRPPEPDEREAGEIAVRIPRRG